MFDHGLANFLFRAGDVSGLQSFFLEGILKLVVGEARRDHLDARHNHRHKHAEAQDQFQCRHQIRSPIPSAGSTGLLVAEAHVLAFGQPANQRTSPSKCSLIAEILMSSRARVERRTTSTKSSVTFFPTLILKGIPTRSASLNLTPGRSSRSSSKTSKREPSRALAMSSAALRIFSSPTLVATTTTSKGAIEGASQKPLASFDCSMAAVRIRSIPIP